MISKLSWLRAPATNFVDPAVLLLSGLSNGNPPPATKLIRQIKCLESDLISRALCVHSTSTLCQRLASRISRNDVMNDNKQHWQAAARIRRHSTLPQRLPGSSETLTLFDNWYPASCP
jgi:hypothetical protein